MGYAELRVLHVGAKNYPPAHGGTERLVQDLVEGLPRIESHVFVDWEPQAAIPRVRQLPAGLRSRRDTICGYARENHIDVIHVHKSSNIPLALALKAAGFRCVLTVHGCVWRRGERRWSSATKAAFWLLDFLACVCLDKVVLVGEHDWLSFRAWFPKRHLILIRNGVRVDGNPRPSERSGCVYLGRISPEKNVIGLIRAAKSLPEKLTLYGPVSPPNARFERDFRAELKRHSVEWKGPVRAEEVGRTLAQHRVFINPSFTEGLPFTVLEAAAEGLHLVLSDIRPHRLLGFPAVTYVDPYKLESALFRGVALDGGAANRSHVKRNYNIEETFKAYASLYSELAEALPQVRQRVVAT